MGGCSPFNSTFQQQTQKQMKMLGEEQVFISRPWTWKVFLLSVNIFQMWNLLVFAPTQNWNVLCGFCDKNVNGNSGKARTMWSRESKVRDFLQACCLVANRKDVPSHHHWGVCFASGEWRCLKLPASVVVPWAKCPITPSHIFLSN